jgi:hypothetical protein
MSGNSTGYFAVCIGLPRHRLLDPRADKEELRRGRRTRDTQRQLVALYPTLFVQAANEPSVGHGPAAQCPTSRAKPKAKAASSSRPSRAKSGSVASPNTQGLRYDIRAVAKHTRVTPECRLLSPTIGDLRDDLIGPLRPARHGAADGRQARLDEAGRVTDGSGLPIHSRRVAALALHSQAHISPV